MPEDVYSLVEILMLLWDHFVASINSYLCHASGQKTFKRLRAAKTSLETGKGTFTNMELLSGIIARALPKAM